MQGAWIEISTEALYNLPPVMSLPVQGAWIEIRQSDCKMSRMRSLPVQGAWIEIAPVGVRWLRALSLPVQGAWIEMRRVVAHPDVDVVAPRAGSVD